MIEKPKVLDYINIDLDRLICVCEHHLNDLGADNDSIHYIYEEVMLALYGGKVFDYINENT